MDLTQTTLLVGILAFTMLVVFYQLKERAHHPARVSGRISKEDRRFLRRAASMAAVEVALSEVALKNSSAPSVQYMAKRIVDDQTQINRRLVSLAWRYGMTVPVEPGHDVRQQARQLCTLRGGAFDHAYDEAIVEDHRKAIELFAAASQSGNRDIRQLAQEALPMLDLHLKLAEQLDPQLSLSPLPPM